MEKPLEYSTFCFPTYRDDKSNRVLLPEFIKAYLHIIIQILLSLNRPQTRFTKRIDFIDPLAAPSTNISSNNSPKWSTMDLRKRLSIHLPSEEDFFTLVCFNLPKWDGNGVVKRGPLSIRSSDRVQIFSGRRYLLEVSLSADELEVLAVWKNTTAGDLEDLLERHTSINSSATDHYQHRRYLAG